MDTDRFDGLTRTLAATGSRRRVLAALAGGWAPPGAATGPVPRTASTSTRARTRTRPRLHSATAPAPPRTRSLSSRSASTPFPITWRTATSATATAASTATAPGVRHASMAPARTPAVPWGEPAIRTTSAARSRGPRSAATWRAAVGRAAVLQAPAPAATTATAALLWFATGTKAPPSATTTPATTETLPIESAVIHATGGEMRLRPPHPTLATRCRPDAWPPPPFSGDTGGLGYGR